MDTANLKQLKTALNSLDREELSLIILRLSKFKKENKELLTYLLFESDNEEQYIQEIKHEVDLEFSKINTSSYFFIKKSIRRILKNIKTYIRYSSVKETEIELRLYFCEKLMNMKPSYSNNVQLTNLYHREINAIKIKVSTLHEDLQYDYTSQIEKLKPSL